MSKDLFNSLREKELYQEDEPLDTHLRICYLRNYNQTTKSK